MDQAANERRDAPLASKLTLQAVAPITALVVRQKVVTIARATAVNKRKTSLSLGIVIPSLLVGRFHGGTMANLWHQGAQI